MSVFYLFFICACIGVYKVFDIGSDEHKSCMVYNLFLFQ